MRQVIRPPARIEGAVSPPGDKSVSHRALLLNTMASGTAHVSNLCHGNDRVSMLRCLRALGARVEKHTSCSTTQAEECFVVHGRGRGGLDEPATVLNAGNSATSLRLIAGLLAAQPFFSVLTGDRSLMRRPMKRIVDPLTQMGATVMGRSEDSMAPLAIRGGSLRGIDYVLPVASSQIKSCILIAGLYTEGETTIHQPSASRDHTERMMRAMGADLVTNGLTITIRPSDLSSMNVRVPGDISGAAFWLVAGCCHRNARVTVKAVGINDSRAGVLDVLRSMGARIRVENVHEAGGEPRADLVAESSSLVATEISGSVIPRVIDELPVLALAASVAKGTTVIKDAGELRLKESDRIRATVEGLSRLGASVEERPDGMVIHGGRDLTGAECQSYGDHRIAMTMAIAGMLAKGQTVVKEAEAAGVSYPGFWDTLSELQRPQG